MSSEQHWHAARLIPTSGGDRAGEQRRRAASALLAVMSAADGFGRALLRPLGAPDAPVRAYTEVPFDNGGVVDGVLRVVRGRRSWTALVDVRTGADETPAQRLADCLRVAREQGFDAVITLSNQVPPLPAPEPGEVLRQHWSWSEVLCEAVRRREHAEAAQAWVLGELIRYLVHPDSGTLRFDDMGPDWAPLREAVRAGTPPPTPAASDAVLRFEALLRLSALELGREAGVGVTPALTRRELADPTSRVAAQVARLAAEGLLAGGLRIAGAVGALRVTADLRADLVTCHVDFDGPAEGRSSTKVGRLVRQLSGAPDTVLLETFTRRGRGAAESLGAVRRDPALLVADPMREVRGFRVARSTPLEAGRDAFAGSVLAAVTAFYRDVVRDLRPWTGVPLTARTAASAARPTSPG
ncbi:hypothetical protein JOF41_006916 [Saccharothrix coeruleofusca]|uniref:hypothetical protein n=1 Tax=Saccharothrix coeruleofusca TaxID=33919 RepID=UPI001AE6EEDA|nr:hypothetical protein [Saccharothrix coeruleofusca]MBP2340738.1 hypothetical protein [Saccharothrix coeruleofusca]